MSRHDSNRLTPRKDGRFCKKVRGVYWTSKSTDPDLAMAEWLAAKKDLLSANPMKVGRVGDPLVRDIVNAFLNDRQERHEGGTMKPRTAAAYIKAVTEFAEIVGRTMPVRQLKPEHFADARRKWAGGLGAWKLSERVVAVRTMFRWAKDVPRLIDFEPWYGDRFGVAPQAEKRRTSRHKAEKNGEPIFGGEEIKLLLSHAPRMLKAMILLGLNGGMYAADCAALRKGEIKERDGFTLFDSDRNKTGVPWSFVLWPETVAALAEVPTLKRKAGDGKHADLVFITHRGNPFYRDVTTYADDGKLENGGEVNAISQEFDRLAVKLGIKREGVGFGKLRHTYVTAVDDFPDANAARRSRGHLLPGVTGEHYRKVTPEHLFLVSQHARRKLLNHPGVY